MKPVSVYTLPDHPRVRRRIQLLILGILLFALAVTVMSRLRVVAAEAERTAFTVTLHRLRAQLGLEVARRLLANPDLRSVESLYGSNPMDLVVPPHNYAGEMAFPDMAAIGPGQWGFEAGEGLLYYRVARPGGFEYLHPASRGMRFRVVPGFAMRKGGGATRGHVRRLVSLRLRDVDAGYW